MADCKSWKNEISKKQADLLDAAGLRELNSHLVECASCRGYSESMSAGLRALSAMPVVAAPKDFLEDSWRRIQKAAPPVAQPTLLERFARWFSERYPAGQTNWIPLGATAVVLLAVILGPEMLNRHELRQAAKPQFEIIAQSGPVSIETMPRGAVRIETKEGGRVEVEHLGRARVVLASAGSRLELGFGRGPRIELTGGSADVSVKKDTAKGWGIDCEGARVVVLGTKFQLVAGPSPMVRVTEGLVKLTGPDFDREVPAGQEVAWNDAGLVGVTAQPSAAPSASAAPSGSPSPAAPASPGADQVKGGTSSPNAAASASAGEPSPSPLASPVPVAAVGPDQGKGGTSPSPSPAGRSASQVEEGTGALNDPFQSSK